MLDFVNLNVIEALGRTPKGLSFFFRNGFSS